MHVIDNKKLSASRVISVCSTSRLIQALKLARYSSSESVKIYVVIMRLLFDDYGNCIPLALSLSIL